MEKSDFKKLFGKIACDNGFEFGFGGWFIESSECIIALDLQKSNFGNFYYLNIKVFIQGTFGRNYSKNKQLVKNEVGNIFTRTPDEFNEILDLDSLIENESRKQKLQKLFADFIVPFTTKALTRAGIKELAQSEDDFLLPAVKEELEKLEKNDRVQS